MIKLITPILTTTNQGQTLLVQLGNMALLIFVILLIVTLIHISLILF